MLVSLKTADQRHWTLGSRHTFAVPGVAPVTLTVGGIYRDDQFIGPWVVSGSVYRALTPRSEWSDDVALVHARPGTDLATLRAGLDKATNDYYVVDIRDRTQYQGMLASQVNGLLGLLYGLLGLAIVIAILGIVNTLALSVVERRREIGMLRAVGMQRSLFARTLRAKGLDVVSVPWTQALLIVVVAGAVGVLAAVWPGIRAARTKPLDAIATG